MTEQHWWCVAASFAGGLVAALMAFWRGHRKGYVQGYKDGVEIRNMFERRASVFDDEDLL